MRRRSFVKLAASGTALGTLAGCTSDGEGPGGTPTADDPTATDTPTDTPTDTTTPIPGGGGSVDTGTMNGVAYRFEVTDLSAGQGRNRATVSFEADARRIVVSGTIGGRDLCRTAVLADVTHDVAADSATVVVATRRREGADMCGQSLVDIDYEARLTFESMPNEVRVVHDGLGGRQEVLSAAYASESVSATPDS